MHVPTRTCLVFLLWIARYEIKVGKITHLEYIILSAIISHDNNTKLAATDIAKMLACHKRNVQQAVQKLIELGYIKRVPGRNDKTSFILGGFFACFMSEFWEKDAIGGDLLWLLPDHTKLSQRMTASKRTRKLEGVYD